jgi:hypothetical protein
VWGSPDFTRARPAHHHGGRCACHRRGGMITRVIDARPVVVLPAGAGRCHKAFSGHGWTWRARLAGLAPGKLRTLAPGGRGQQRRIERYGLGRFGLHRGGAESSRCLWRRAGGAETVEALRPSRLTAAHSGSPRPSRNAPAEGARIGFAWVDSPAAALRADRINRVILRPDGAPPRPPCVLVGRMSPSRYRLEGGFGPRVGL